MKVWKLVPLHAVGSAAPKGWVMIRAQDETRARQIAAHAFEKAKARAAKTLHSPQWAALSWEDPKQVSCEYQNDDISNEEGILGME